MKLAKFLLLLCLLVTPIFSQGMGPGPGVKSYSGGGGCTSTIFEDLFNSYSDGDLNAQGSWTGSTEYDVETGTAAEGSKGVQNAHSTGGTISATFADTATASLYFAMRRTSVTGGDTGYVRLEDPAGNGTIVYFKMVDGSFEYYDDGTLGYQTLGSYSADTWYWINMEWDASGHPNQYRIRMKSGGTWGSFTSWTSTYQSFSTIDTVMLDIDGAGGTRTYWDSFSDCDRS